MTIHRCLDYTKASQGLKLVPRLESFLLFDAMEMPMQCMQGMVVLCSICYGIHIKFWSVEDKMVPITMLSWALLLFL
jgi:hypothetical protein